MAFMVASATAVFRRDRRAGASPLCSTARATRCIASRSLPGALEIVNSASSTGSSAGAPAAASSASPLPVLTSTGSVRWSVTRVTSSSCSQFSPANVASSSSRKGIMPAPPYVLAHQRAQPPEAEHLARLVVRLHQPVAVKEHRVPRLQHDLLLVVVHSRHQAQRHPCGAQLDRPPRARRRAQVGQVVAGVGDSAARRLPGPAAHRDR